MDNLREICLPERAQSLAIQKMRARLIRESMFLDKNGFEETNLAKKVIKYETFLSHQMINRIKTEQIDRFQKQVQQFCKKPKSMDSSNPQSQHLGIQRFLDSIKKDTKTKLIKLKNKTDIQQKQQSYSPNSSKAQHSPQKHQSRQTSPHLKHKTTFELKRKRQIFDQRTKLKGTMMKSSLIDLMQKIEAMNIPKLKSQYCEEPLSSSIEGQSQSSSNLKQQKQRLNTVLQKNGSVDFKPIGNVRKITRNKRYHQISQKKQFSQVPSISTNTSNFSSKQLLLNSLSNEEKKLKQNLQILPINRNSLFKLSNQNSNMVQQQAIQAFA